MFYYHTMQEFRALSSRGVENLSAQVESSAAGVEKYIVLP